MSTDSDFFKFDGRIVDLGSKYNDTDTKNKEHYRRIEQPVTEVMIRINNSGLYGHQYATGDDRLIVQIKPE